MEAYKKFQHAKMQCLYGHKRDKSSVGQLDDGVIEICTLINENFHEYYTTSSCAGRCFLYTGMGIKSTNSFVRCRISHIKIKDPIRYFNLHTLREDPTGGGDIIPQVYDGGKRQRQFLRRQQQLPVDEEGVSAGEQRVDDDKYQVGDGDIDDEPAVTSTYQNNGEVEDHGDETNQEEQDTATYNYNNDDDDSTKKIWWIRYEPFILHVACRSLNSAIQFMNIVRPIFKTVGITSLSHAADTTTTNSDMNHISGCPKYVVAIFGDEGLDMPLTNEEGISMVDVNDADTCGSRYSSYWLASLVNERHERNANKIERLVQAIRNTVATIQSNGLNLDENDNMNMCDTTNDDSTGTATNSMFVNINGQQIRIPRSYDVIGDVAILHTIPSFNKNAPTDTDVTEENNIDYSNFQLSLREAIGEAIIQRNKNIKVVVLRSSNLDGNERAPGMNGIQILTGPSDRVKRLPLITTHREYGVSCVVNIHHTFFSPRMGQERIRICEQIGQHNEHVLVLFAGVCMDAFQIVARTNALSVTAVESNDYAYECAQKGQLLLERNKQCLHQNASERLKIIHGDCLQVIPTLPLKHYHRILAPRPKEGNLDGDQPPSNSNEEDTDRIGGSGGKDFLIALLSVLQPNGGICHWYDFCADHEYPQCKRTVQFLSDICKNEYQYDIKVINVAHVGSIAKRQLRICVDFSVSPC